MPEVWHEPFRVAAAATAQIPGPGPAQPSHPVQVLVLAVLRVQPGTLRRVRRQHQFLPIDHGGDVDDVMGGHLPAVMVDEIDRVGVQNGRQGGARRGRGP